MVRVVAEWGRGTLALLNSRCPFFYQDLFSEAKRSPNLHQFLSFTAIILTLYLIETPFKTFANRADSAA